MIHLDIFLIYILNKDPFDCKTDPCHLAWLLRDNRELLDNIDGAACSNGTLFEDLNPDSFKQCPSSYI